MLPVILTNIINHPAKPRFIDMPNAIRPGPGTLRPGPGAIRPGPGAIRPGPGALDPERPDRARTGQKCTRPGSKTDPERHPEQIAVRVCFSTKWFIYSLPRPPAHPDARGARLACSVRPAPSRRTTRGVLVDG